MGIGSEIGKEGGVVAQGILQSVVAWIYNKVFATQIAAQQKERDDLKAQVKELQAQVAARVDVDQKQIDTAEAEKPAIVKQIKVEQARQVEDEKKIEGVKADEAKQAAVITSKPDSDLLRDDF